MLELENIKKSYKLFKNKNTIDNRTITIVLKEGY